MQEKITFDNRKSQALAGVLHLLESAQSHACAIFAHCFTCTKNSKAALIYRNAKHPKSFVSLDNADHLLTRDQDSRYAARVLATWASRYVGAVSPEPLPGSAYPGE